MKFLYLVQPIWFLRYSLTLFLILGCNATAANESTQKNTVQSLHEAILHLSETYGSEYPNGKTYLKRLEQITDASSDEYKQVQREALLNHPYVKGYEWLIEVHNPYWGNHGPMNTLFQN